MFFLEDIWWWGRDGQCKRQCYVWLELRKENENQKDVYESREYRIWKADEKEGKEKKTTKKKP